MTQEQILNRALDTKTTITEGEHWIFAGSHINGYPIVRAEGRQFFLYKLLWERHHGELPRGKRLQNYCGKTMCVNPEHWGLPRGKQKAAKPEPTILVTMKQAASWGMWDLWTEIKESGLPEKKFLLSEWSKRKEQAAVEKAYLSSHEFV